MNSPVPFTRISMHIGDDSVAYTFTYADVSPILDISTGNASISITPTSRTVDDAALTFARQLLMNVQVFAAEVERLHAEQSARSVAKLPGRAA